jgi:predicted Zn-dependent protease
MKYKFRQLEHDENVSSVRPMQEFLVYIGGITSVLIVLFFALGFFVDILANNLPQAYVDRIYDIHIRKDTISYLTPPERLETLLKRIGTLVHVDIEKFKMMVISSSQENAFMTFQREIILSETLLKNITSENELAFILAHELGHYYYRHHIKSLGRNLFVIVFSLLVSGQQQGIGESLSKIVNFSSLHFSREQEEQCDQFAINIVNKLYGHTAGALNFFKRIEDKNHLEFLYGSTHPLTSERIKDLTEYSKNKGYISSGKMTTWKYP